MFFYWLILGIFSVWRITHLLHGEDGPGDVFVRLRRVAGEGFWGKLLDCFYCLSLWISLPFSLLLGDTWKERLLLWPALSAGAILMERITTRENTVPIAHYCEDEENPDVLLRREEKHLSSEPHKPPEP